ncbi:MAG: Rap1a/Tai family immunity protein [Sulfuritalea sp.]|nr:Rap1a/Tai family immunity protein [Sulfuritalea sp.]
MTPRLLVAFPLFLLAVLDARALTSREMLEEWCSGGSAAAAGRCFGYLLAAEDALSAHSLEGVRACLPGDISLQQQHRILIEWMRAHPEARSATALGLVARAYAESYPCSK